MVANMRAWTVAVLLLSLSSAAAAIPMVYCSSLNTATTDGTNSIYQSDGQCRDSCFQKQSFALAIVNYQTCWCSNYIPDPAVQVPLGECNKPCPGYPSDTCGGGSGTDLLYGYMANDAVKPSGTASAGASKPSASSPPGSGPAPPPSKPTSASTASTPNPDITGSPSVDGASATPSVTVQTVTADGSVITVISTAASTPNAGNDGNNTGPDDSSDGKIGSGAMAGISIAAVAAVAGGIGLFLCLRRRRRGGEDAKTSAPVDAGSKRDSSAGMMTTTRTNELSESRFAVGAEGRAMAENWEGSGRRRSTLMPMDPRLDFGKGVYARNENPSHESINSLQDNEDYSRRVHVPKPLRAVNPDPD